MALSKEVNRISFVLKNNFSNKEFVYPILVSIYGLKIIR